MSAHAIGIMLKSILGSRIDPIIEKVDELNADGTIDRAVSLLRILAQEGAIEKAVILLNALDEHNQLLREILDEQIRTARGPTELDTCSERLIASDDAAYFGTGSAGQSGPD